MNWWSRVLDFVSPRYCVVCDGRLAPTERTLCSACLMRLPRTTFQFAPEDNVMAQLFWGLAPVCRAAALFYYQPHADDARVVYQLKYGDRPDVGEDMGRLMAGEMRFADYFGGVDLLVPVPLSPRRLRQRGYNQSESLALGVSQATGIPVCRQALCRRHFRQSQTRLSRRERQENVSGMFYVSHPERLCDRHIMLIDDVCTTGATLTACCDALKGVPGVTVSVLTLCFTER